MAVQKEEALEHCFILFTLIILKFNIYMPKFLTDIWANSGELHLLDALLYGWTTLFKF